MSLGRGLSAGIVLAGCVGVALGVADGRAQAAKGNPLLGTWVLKSGPKGCNTRMVFTANHKDFTWRGSTSGAPVSGYVVKPGSVIVGGSPGVIETFTYVIVDANTVKQPTSSDPCVWKRG